jgi:DNA-binding NtrC family response regulator
MTEPDNTRRLDGSDDSFTFQRFRVVVVAGPDAGAECVATGPELAIGTAPTNDLVLTDPTASRHHCVIDVGPSVLRVRDLGSTNGTRLGPHYIEVARLVEDAMLTLGTTCIRCEILNETVREPLRPEPTFAGVLGKSPTMRRIFTMMSRIASSDATVLIEGETGTGKTLLAEALHRESPRAAGPFIVLDCAAIPANLIESELFGHERGAFTGAHSTRIGAFEAANGGTLFLDEIGELPLDMQPKLLRVLENRVIKRVGSTHSQKIDVRMVAATNRDLRAAVNDGTFRSDLFYRLNVATVHVPPLRERREDIALLVDHFFREFSGGQPPPPALVASFERQRWPGNVRELRAAVERTVLLGEPVGDPPSSDALPDLPIDLAVPFRTAKQRMVDHWERSYFEALLRQAGGSITRAAREARMDRNYLRERLQRLAIPLRPGAD